MKRNRSSAKVLHGRNWKKVSKYAYVLPFKTLLLAQENEQKRLPRLQHRVLLSID